MNANTETIKHAYLFAAGATLSQMRPSGFRGDKTLQTWDTCLTAILYAGNAEQAQKTFEDWCQTPREGEDPVQTEIKKMVGVELIDQLLTESGGGQLDCPAISARLIESIPTIETEAQTSTTTEDPGYWVDVHHAVPPESGRLDMESLKRGLPEDIVAALNWSADKTFIFLLSSLSAPSVAADLYEETEESEADVAGEQGRGEKKPVLDQAVAQLPEMREKEAAALVEARNSVVAAWLWRKFTAKTRLISNEIVLNPCCAIIPGDAPA